MVVRCRLNPRIRAKEQGEGDPGLYSVSLQRVLTYFANALKCTGLSARWRASGLEEEALGTRTARSQKTKETWLDTTKHGSTTVTHLEVRTSDE